MDARPPRLDLALLVAVGLAGACSGSGAPGAGPGGAMGNAGAPAAGAGGAGTSGGGAPGSGGSGGATSAAGSTGQGPGGEGGGGAPGGGTSGAGSTGTAGAGGAAAGGATGGASGGGGSRGGGGTPGLTDPGTDGDGDFMLASPHPLDPLNTEMGSPKGTIFTFVMKSSDSKIYPGRNGPYMRNVWVYVPKSYVPGTPAPFMTIQDGGFLVWLGTNAPHTPDSGTATTLPGTTNLPRVLDNLIAMGKLPKVVAIFVDNGGGDAEGSERGLEYDTVSGVYATFVDGEVLPRVVAEAKSQLGVTLAFTTDPQGRASIGGSSGGAAAFSMAWWHPELFGRLIIFSGTFVRQASPEDPLYPHGCWSYHDYDPYDATAPNGLVMRDATAKPIRVWIEAAQNDSGAGGGPTSYRDFRLAGQRMAASFAARGYHYHFDYALGAGHFDGGVIGQTMPAALEWLWRGYPVD